MNKFHVKNNFELGFKAPDFRLLDVISGERYSLNELTGKKGIVLMFLANHNSYVKHINEEIVRIANDYRVIGFGFAAISSSDLSLFPEDSPQQMIEVAREEHYPFPYLFDEDQQVLKAYHITQIPDFMVFNQSLKMTYHGQLDDSRPQNNIPLSGSSLRRALDAILLNRPALKNQKSAEGICIKKSS